MTIIAHGLWATAIYKPIRKTNWKLAVFWAIFPDLIWGIPFIPYLLIFQQPIPTDFNNAIWWLYHLYGLGHSFIIAGVTIIGVFLLIRRIPREMFAWPLLHILLDIPGHTSFKTPFLYPVSDFTIPGPFSWNDQPCCCLTSCPYSSSSTNIFTIKSPEIDTAKALSQLTRIKSNLKVKPPIPDKTLFGESFCRTPQPP